MQFDVGVRAGPLAKELGADGVFVNCVAPGFTVSDGGKQHPEVRDLTGANSWTFFVIVGVVAFQLSVAWLVRDLQWWWMLAPVRCAA